MRAAALPLVVLSVVFVPAYAAIPVPKIVRETNPDEQTLAAAGLSTDGPALLAFFRGRARLDVDREQLLTLTRQLADVLPEVRARAAAELVGRGAVAVPALRHAINDLSDPAVASRARRCLEAIEGSAGAALPAAAARLLALRKPPGATEVLLAYLPYADDQAVVEQVTQTLIALAFVDGRPDPALLHALEDPLPVRRAVAGEALCRQDKQEQLPAVRKLLQDPKPTVRLRAALALVKQHDPEAIPVLIDLLADLPPEQRKQAEDFLQQLAGEWAPNASLPGDDDISRRIRRDAWAAWWRNTDGPALLAEFRKRTLTPDDQKKIESLLEKLEDESFSIREQATSALVAFGSAAVPFLREATRAEDLERKRRAENCLRLIEQNETRSLPTAAPRLALRRPEGAVEALLAYLPHVEGDAMAEEVKTALTTLAVRQGKPDPAVVQALSDKLPLRRAAAAEALTSAAGPEARPAVRKLLQDPEATVRLRVALALAAAHEKEAVPVLIESLAELPNEQAAPAYETLIVLAGDKAPSAALGQDEDSRRKCRDAWLTWWKTNAAKTDLTKLTGDEAYLGYTLLVEVDPAGGNNGRVQELGRDGKLRWSVDNLQYPVDAWVLPGNRVLIAEYTARRVTERDFKGKILWEKSNLTGLPTNAQRLANGHTFISTHQEVLEVDRTGKEVFRHNFGGGGVTAAYKSRNGVITAILNNGNCVRLDASGKEIKNFPSGRMGGWTSGIDVLPNGHVLVAAPNRNMVLELDTQGKTVWQVNAPDVTTATRLRNGHILVASSNSQRAYELDRSGKEVWEHKDGYHVFRVRRR